MRPGLPHGPGLQGKLEQSLIDSSELAAPLNGLYQYAIKNVYQAREVIEVEAMGYKVLGELIDFFMEWVNHPSSGQSQKIAIMLQGTGVPRNNGGPPHLPPDGLGCPGARL